MANFIMSKALVYLCAAVVFIFFLAGVAHTNEISELKTQLKAMMNQMEEMQKKIEKLEATDSETESIISANSEESSVVVKDEKALSLEGILEGPLFVKIGHGDLKLHGYLQGFYAWHEHDSGDDTFDIRRAFLILDGNISENIDYRVLIDAAASSNILRDAYIKYKHFPYANIKAGQFKIPFSEEWLTSSSTIDTIQRARVVTALSYDRDIGVMLEGKLYDDKFYYATGVFNGAGRNTSDNNENKDFIGRVVFSPFKGSKNLLDDLSFGASYQIGSQPEIGTNKGNRNRYGSLFKYKYDKFKFQGEYIFQEQEQTDRSGIDSDGWYAMATYRFIPDFQGVLKYEQYDPNRDVPKDREDIITVGCDWYLNEYTKLQANYRYKDEQTEEANDEFLLQAQVKF